MPKRISEEGCCVAECAIVLDLLERRQSVFKQFDLLEQFEDVSDEGFDTGLVPKFASVFDDESQQIKEVAWIELAFEQLVVFLGVGFAQVKEIVDLA